MRGLAGGLAGLRWAWTACGACGPRWRGDRTELRWERTKMWWAGRLWGAPRCEMEAGWAGGRGDAVPGSRLGACSSCSREMRYAFGEWLVSSAPEE